MKKHILRIREIDKDFFDIIENGLKTIETRAATNKLRAIKKGDILVFVCGDKKLEKRVKEVSYFKTIEELIKKIDLKKIMPLVSSLEEAKKVWYSFPNYEKKISKFGLLAFDLEKD